MAKYPACLSFVLAPHQKVSQALLFVQDELRRDFPTIAWLIWAQALDQLKPDLWVTPTGSVYLAEEELARLRRHLTKHVADATERARLGPPAYGPVSQYLAQRLNRYTEEARAARTEHGANPSAYAPYFHDLIADLAEGNFVAEQVLNTTSRGPSLGGRGPLVPTLREADAIGNLLFRQRLRDILFAGRRGQLPKSWGPSPDESQPTLHQYQWPSRPWMT